MVDEPQKPTLRHRRRIVLLPVLILVGIFSWWFWPRGDARFVGKWELWKPGLAEPAEYFEFRANGMMYESGRRDRSDRQSVPWDVNGSTLTMGYDVGEFASVTDSISALIHRFTGWWPIVTSAGRWEFQQIDSDTIEIRLDDNNVFTLRRTIE